MSEILIVEQHLRNFQGHYFGLLQGIYKAAQSAGYDVRAFVDRKVVPEITQQLDVIPVFDLIDLREQGLRLRKFRALGRFVERWILRTTLVRQLRRALNKQNLTPKTLVILATVNHMLLPGIAAWYCALPAEQRPRLLMVLHTNISPRFRKDAGRILNKIHDAGAGQAVMGALNANLARETQTISALPVRVLPMPVSQDPIDESAVDTVVHDTLPTVPNSWQPGGKRWIVAPGMPRDDKNLHIVCQAIEQINRQGKGGGFQFVLQAWGNVDKQSITNKAFAQLERAGYENVHLLKQYLTAEEYGALINRAEIILIPYRVREHRYMFSAIFAEAVGLGKPIIVTEGTWVAEQLDHFGSGIKVKDGDVDDLARAILALDTTYPEHAQRALATRNAWHEWHNPTSFVREVIALWESDAPK